MTKSAESVFTFHELYEAIHLKELKDYSVLPFLNIRGTCSSPGI